MHYSYMKDQKYDDISEVRTYNIRGLVLKPGKSSLPPEKKIKRAPHALEDMDRAET